MSLPFQGQWFLRKWALFDTAGGFGGPKPGGPERAEAWAVTSWGASLCPGGGQAVGLQFRFSELPMIAAFHNCRLCLTQKKNPKPFTSGRIPFAVPHPALPGVFVETRQ